MITFAEIAETMLSESGGCPEMILERQLRNTAIEFLAETEIWQDRRTIPTVPAVGEYLLTVSSDERIHKLTYCSVDDKELLQTVPHRTFPKDGLSQWYFLRDDTLHIRPFELIKGDIEVEIILTINRLAEGIPDSVGDRWMEALQKGALARTLSMATTPWYDPRSAQLYFTQYGIMTQNARREGTRATHSRIRTTRFSW
jgi:hypothetical protein